MQNVIVIIIEIYLMFTLSRAADVTDRNGLSYREFLFILAAIDPYTAHGGGPAEIRCRYMFRYKIVPIFFNNT